MFLKAAARRLDAAQALLGLKVAAFHLDAMYLAGYSVECALKAMIIEATPRVGRPERIAALTAGSRSHNILYLRRSYQSISGVNFPGEVNILLVRTSTWSTDWRYETRFVRAVDALAFCEAARAVLDHARSRLV